MCVASLPPVCKSLHFLHDVEGLGAYNYTSAAGIVPFYAQDLPNTKTWLTKENYILTPAREMMTGPLSCHLCRYVRLARSLSNL